MKVLRIIEDIGAKFKIINNDGSEKEVDLEEVVEEEEAHNEEEKEGSNSRN